MFNYVGPAKPLDEVESRTLDSGRFYKIDDKWCPSVTTVCGNQSKHGILAWQKRVGSVSYTHLTLPTIYSV